jgi:hypothetical protein
MVVHTCNPSYVEAEIRRIVVQGQPVEISKTPFPSELKTSWVQCWVGEDGAVYNPSYRET